ncbi:MAG: type II toxin-antitoxin system HicA family toxin [Proteiniphilum sp.]
MKFSEIKRKLTKGGCFLHRQGANHEIWYSPITERYFPVSRHNSEEAHNKTKNSIEEQSGVTL